MQTDNTDNVVSEIHSALERGERIEVRVVPDEPPSFEINLVKLGRALLLDWKRILAVTLVMAFIGMICSFIYYMKPKQVVSATAEVFPIVSIDINDDYSNIFNDFGKLNNNLNTYLDAIYANLQAANYPSKAKDSIYLISLKNENNQIYSDNFNYAFGIYSIYKPVRNNDINKKVINLQLRQQELTNQMSAVEAEISYLKSVAASGMKISGSATDAALASGVQKANTLATLKREYQENAILLNELLGITTNQERSVQQAKMENLLRNGTSAYVTLIDKVNKFAGDYAKLHGVDITSRELSSKDDPNKLIYTVIVDRAVQPLSPLRYAVAITTLMACLGFGLGCIWIFYRYFKSNDERIENCEI